jgi:hypothetical protein
MAHWFELSFTIDKISLHLFCFVSLLHTGGSRDRDHMLIGFATSFATSAYHHQSCDFESRSSRGALDTTLHDKVCQLLASGRWFSPGPPVSSTNRIDHYDITEIIVESGVKHHNPGPYSMQERIFLLIIYVLYIPGLI